MDKFSFEVNFIKQSCGLDVRDHLSKILTLDMLILNEDRHYNNLAIKLNGEEFLPASMFDNGVSLLTANQSVNWRFPMEGNVKRVIARPFSGSHERVVKYLGTGFEMDWENALKWLESESESRERNALKKIG